MEDVNGFDGLGEVIEGIEQDAVNGLGATNRRRNIGKLQAVMLQSNKVTATVKHHINKGRLVNRKFQIVEKTITEQGSVITISENIKQEFSEVKGLFVVVSDTEAAKSVTITMRHKGIEVLPEGFDLNLLTDRENVSMDDFTLPLQLDGNTAKIDGSLSVGLVDDALLVTGTDKLKTPVSVKLYFVCKDAKTTER